MRWAVAAALLALAACRAETAPVKPELYVLTSLPLLFDEGFALGPAKGEAAVFLREHYTLRPIDLPSQLPPGATLLAAQPRALPAEELVALDAWVRGGGRMLLLADPMLEWPSDRPFGDRLRPPLAYPDTGLLAHWGLRLDAPDKRGLRYDPMNGAIAFISPGTLVKVGGQCAIEEGGWMALCGLDKGRVDIIPDADFLNVEAVRKAGGFPSDNLRVIDRLIRPPAKSPK
ncbi:MAG: hypothetical protein ABIR87_01515 [Sphingomicrobium sp.]